MDVSTVESEALLLPETDRAALAHKLLLSLNDIAETSQDDQWLDVAEARARAIDAGRTKLDDAQEVNRKARALLR